MRTALQLLAAALWLIVSPQLAAAQQWKVSGPYTHANLAVYLIHGSSTSQTEYLTLEEAMASDQAAVFDGDQNRLEIKNTSERVLYVQSGDIVKGAHQDRSLGTDFVMKPGGARQFISAYCVEEGRSTVREGDPEHEFISSTHMLAGRLLRVAGNRSMGPDRQKLVWEQISNIQQKLTKNANADFSGGNAPSSMQLTLENPDVRRAGQAYVDAINRAIEAKADVIGCAIAINGRFTAADVYGPVTLFRKLWPRLLYSAAVEAVAEMKSATDAMRAPAADAIRILLMEAARGATNEMRVNEQTTIRTIESHRAVLFETPEPGGTGFLHRNYLAKD